MIDTVHAYDMAMGNLNASAIFSCCGLLEQFDMDSCCVHVDRFLVILSTFVFQYDSLSAFQCNPYIIGLVL